MSEKTDSPEVMKWYTHALKIPTLIGKPPGGGHYWGGPYSVTQVLGAIGLFITGQMTMSLWGLWSGLINNLVLALASIGTLFALRLVKPGGRNPLIAVMSIGGALLPPLGGQFRGRPIRRRLPHRVRNGQINALIAVPASKPKAAPGTAAEHVTSPAPTVDLRKPAPTYALSESAPAGASSGSAISAPVPDRHNPFLPAPTHNPFL